MIQHINNKVFLILFVLFSFIRCKDYNDSKELSGTLSINNYSISNEKNILVDTNSPLKEITKKNKKIKNWIFYKVVPLSNNYECDTELYKNFKFSISNDSVFIDNIYTDDVYRGIIKSNKYFPQKYLYNLYKDFLPKNFNVALSSEIDNIRNKNVYSKKSKLDKYFEDAFFINDYMFFEKNGCVYSYIKDKNKIENTKIKNAQYFKVPISTKKIKNTSPLKIDEKIFKEYSCGSNAFGFNLGKKDEFEIYIVNNDCGDFPFKDLVLLKGNKIISKLFIEGDSWDIEQDEKNIRDEIITTFEIDVNFIIKLKTVNKLNDKLKSSKTDTYQVINGKIIKK